MLCGWVVNKQPGEKMAAYCRIYDQVTCLLTVKIQGSALATQFLLSIEIH